MRSRVLLLVCVIAVTSILLLATIASAHSIYLPMVIGPSGSPGFYTITGHVQKGPFRFGSQITVAELDPNLQPTGRTLTGTVDSDTGRFIVRGTLSSPYVEITAQGLYFNEVAEAQSVQPITLVALAQLDNNSTVNVNLLTHLERARIRTLQSEGASFMEASAGAQRDVLAVFNLMPSETTRPSTELNIAQPGNDNAMLLAASLVMQSDLAPVQLTDLLGIMAADLGPDGLLDSAATQQTLIAGMEYIRPRLAAIRAALQDYYADQPELALIPPFEAYALALDTVAPTVVSTAPANGADQGVRTVSAVFSELILHSTLTPQTIVLENAQGAAIQGTVSITDTFEATQANVVPIQDLVEGSYVLRISAAVRDLAGNPLADTVIINFTHTPIGRLAATNTGPTPLREETELVAAITATSDPVTFTWDLGDGTLADGATVHHTYPAVGEYTATVTARNSFSTTSATTRVSIIDRGIVGLQASAANPTRLNDATTLIAGVQDGTNIMYSWDFGDGATGTGKQVNHTYAAVGDYTVTVTATNSINQIVTTKPISVIDREITGLRAEHHRVVPAGEPFTLAAGIDDGSNVTYNWTFGDGNVATGTVVTHTYVYTGYFDITLTAVNSVGQAFLVQSIIALSGWTQDEVVIPAGTFQMGCDINNLPAGETCRVDNVPLHTVFLDAYSIDKYEVTNARYRACVQAGRCNEPNFNRSATREPYYTDPDYADYPVVFVTWNQARDFCVWDGGRLPTEAEWEKTARGNSDTRPYTWGDAQPDCTFLNFNDSSSAVGQCVGDTTRVGRYAASDSPYGAMDMLGNVSEFVNDFYDVDYYVDSPSSNPQGPAGDVPNYVRRGTSWNEGRPRVDLRGSFMGSSGLEYIGFRCVHTP